MVRQQEALGVKGKKEEGKQSHAVLWSSLGVAMKKNSFVTTELGGIIGIPNRYEPDLVL